jgi:hypothetical protein
MWGVDEIDAIEGAPDANRDTGGLFVEGNKVGRGGAQLRVKDETILAAEAEDVARRVIRDAGNVNITTLAAELGWTKERVRNFLATPQYKAIFAKVSEEFWGTIDDHIKDERLDSLTRTTALNARGLTLLGDIFDIVGIHIHTAKENGITPRATLVKAGVDAIAEARQMAAAARGEGKNAAAGTVNINITGKHASLIQGALAESGINISDVLDNYVDAEVVNETPTQ